MATDTTPKNDKKPAKPAKATKTAKAAAKPAVKTKDKTKEKAASTAKSAKQQAADAKRRAKDRAKATGELKDGLTVAASAAGHTAEVLAADVKAGADKASTTVKAKSAEAAIAGTRMATRIPKSAWSLAIGLAATSGILVKWIRSRRAKNRET